MELWKSTNVSIGFILYCSTIQSPLFMCISQKCTAISIDGYLILAPTTISHSTSCRLVAIDIEFLSFFYFFVFESTPPLAMNE